ncbi:hypothetical protein Tco_0898325 [Tanacetum coccineum]
MNKKSYSFDLDTFKNMLQICPKLPGQHFVDTPFEEDILAFMRELGILELSSFSLMSRAQILWGLYHQENVDFVYLLWEDLVYQIENKESKKNKYMYYPRFTKVIINHFMSQDQSILRRNKVDWHMANDDPILTTMRFIPQHEVVQKYGAILPDYLTTQAMKESEAYKTYHALATGKVQPKPKYVRRSSRTKTDDVPKPSSGKRVKATAKVANLTQTHISQPSGSGAHKGTVKPGVPDVPTYRSDDEEIPWKSSDDEDDDEANTGTDEDDDDQDDDDNADQDNDDERTEYDNVGDDFVHPKFTNFVDDVGKGKMQRGIDSIFNVNTEATSLVNVPVTTLVEPPILSTTTLPPPPTPFISNLQQTPVPSPAIFPSSSLQNLPNIVLFIRVSLLFPTLLMHTLQYSCMKRLKQLVNCNQTTQDEAQPEGNEDFSLKLDVTHKENIRTSKETSLRHSLLDFAQRIKKMDKDGEPSVGSNRGSKRRRAGKEPESTSAPKERTTKPSGKSNKGSKSDHKFAGQSAYAEVPMHTTEDVEEPTRQEFKTGVTEDQPETSYFPDWFQKPDKLPSPDSDWNKTLPAAHRSTQPWLSILARNEDPRELFNKVMDTLLDLSTFVINRLHVDSLAPEILVEVYKATTEQLDWINPEGQQYPHDLRKPIPLIPNSRGRRVIPFDHFINNDLEYLSGGDSSRKYATLVTKTKAADYGHIKWIEDLVPNTIESARDVYSKRRIIAVTKLEIVEWQNYKHLYWITVRRDDDKLYKFKEGKLTNLTVEERLAFNVSLRMFTRSIVIQRRVEDLQLGVESYQKKLNLTKPYTLMRIDELHKFSDGTLNDVRTALNDRLKGIRMQYLPQTIWRQHDKENARAMIYAIEKKLKTMRIMRSLEKFVGGRQYEGDLRLLQRTI